MRTIALTLIIISSLQVYCNQKSNKRYNIAEYNQVFEIDENVTGAEVGQIALTTPDNVNLTFTINSENEIFTIISETGIIYLKQNVALNYESVNQYSFQVNISDGNSSESVSVTVNVNDINDIPTIKNDTIFITENISNTIVIGELTAYDEDKNSLFTDWTILRGNDDNTFKIHPTSGKIKIVDNTTIDREINEELTIAVSVSDGIGTSELTDIKIIITDVNDNSPEILKNQIFSVNESSKKGHIIGYLNATDADKNTDFTNWNIREGIEDQIFEIDSNTGQISLEYSGLDYEKKTEYRLQVTVGDGKNTSSPEEITISIIDVNDNKPVINKDQIFTISSDLARGNKICTLKASDPDTETVLQQWSIVSGNISETFNIDSNTGTITLNNPKILQSVNIDSYTLYITVTDGLNSSDTVPIKIIINKTTNINKTENSLPNNYYDYRTKQIYIDNSGELKPYKIVISNINGSLIDNFIVNLETNAIDIAHLRKSIYIVRFIYTSGETKLLKIAT